MIIDSISDHDVAVPALMIALTHSRLLGG